MQRKKGFTLTELLVVIVIIGILSAVVLPKFNKMLEARKTTEAENIMTAVRSEQEARCSLDTEYATTTADLKSWPKNGSKNFSFSVTRSGITARNTEGDYALEMPSYRDGRICCSGDGCDTLNKNYMTCQALLSKIDYKPADESCTPGDLGGMDDPTWQEGVDPGTNPAGKDCPLEKPATEQKCKPAGYDIKCGNQTRTIWCDESTNYTWKYSTWSSCSPTSECDGGDIPEPDPDESCDKEPYEEDCPDGQEGKIKYGVNEDCEFYEIENTCTGCQDGEKRNTSCECGLESGERCVDGKWVSYDYGTCELTKEEKRTCKCEEKPEKLDECPDGTLRTMGYECNPSTGHYEETGWDIECETCTPSRVSTDDTSADTCDGDIRDQFTCPFNLDRKLECIDVWTVGGGNSSSGGCTSDAMPPNECFTPADCVARKPGANYAWRCVCMSDGLFHCTVDDSSIVGDGGSGHQQHGLAGGAIGLSQDSETRLEAAKVVCCPH